MGDELDDVEGAGKQAVGAAFAFLHLQIEAQGSSQPQSDLHQDENHHDAVDEAL